MEVKSCKTKVLCVRDIKQKRGGFPGTREIVGEIGDPGGPLIVELIFWKTAYKRG